MNAAKVGLLAALVIANIAFVAGWISAAKRHGLRERPTVADIAIKRDNHARPMQALGDLRRC